MTHHTDPLTPRSDEPRTRTRRERDPLTQAIHDAVNREDWPAVERLQRELPALVARADGESNDESEVARG